MTFVSCSQLIFLLILIISCIGESKANRYRRQNIDGTNTNIRTTQSNIGRQVPLNNVPLNPSNNPQLIVSNEPINLQQINNNNPRSSVPQPQLEPVRSREFFNNPASPSLSFSGEKPLGWFGTSRVNWVSNRDSELDKHKLAAQQYSSPNNPQLTIIQPRADGGPLFLEKVAKQYASKDDKLFTANEFESHGSTCSNFDNFNGFVFGNFICPLPASTGMNPLDQFCCGRANYQYCCNAQEFSQTQRGAFADHRSTDRHGFPTRTEYSPATKRILRIISPIASFIVLIGLVIFVFLYYKKFRKEQNRIRKPAGATRLDDDYSVVPQEPSVEQSISTRDEL
ncbi:unnamed protein product [Rotaria socialis]